MIAARRLETLPPHPATLHEGNDFAALIRRVASSDATLLFEGETGSGKSFLARRVHEGSDRARHPLRVINCASLPEPLVEAELFGHARGAFTGAFAPRVGALEAVGEGTLFLDEIGELPLATQAKLLHVLEERRFERLGSNRSIRLEARVLCATNRDLDAMMERGAFRRDLFYRISVVRVRVPPLRERSAELVRLANDVLLAADARPVKGFSADALRAITLYPWPGNIRELRNAIEHALLLGDGEEIRLADLPAAVAEAATTVASGAQAPLLVELPATLASLEKSAIHAALRHANGNKSKAAACLGISRQALYDKLARMERERPEP